MSGFGSLLARQMPVQRTDGTYGHETLWRAMDRKWAGVPGSARASLVAQAAGNKRGASASMYLKGDGAGRSRIVTYFLVGKGRAVDDRDPTPSTADLDEAVNDYGLNAAIQQSPDRLARWFEENVYPLPSGYPKTKFHMIYYNKRKLGDQAIFNWSSFVSVLRKFVLKGDVMIKKGADAARKVMQGLMRVKDIYKKHFNVANEDEDPWCMLIRSYFSWYSQAHLAAGGEHLANPFAEKQFGVKKNMNAMDLIKKSHKDAMTLAAGLGRTAILAIPEYSELGQNSNVNTYKFALDAALRGHLMSDVAPGWAADGGGLDAWGRILKALENTLTVRQQYLLSGKRVSGEPREKPPVRVGRTRARMVESARKAAITRKLKNEQYPRGRSTAASRAAAKNQLKRAAEYARAGKFRDMPNRIEKYAVRGKKDAEMRDVQEAALAAGNAEFAREVAGLAVDNWTSGGISPALNRAMMVSVNPEFLIDRYVDSGRNRSYVRLLREVVEWMIVKATSGFAIPTVISAARAALQSANAKTAGIPEDFMSSFDAAVAYFREWNDIRMNRIRPAQTEGGGGGGGGGGGPSGGKPKKQKIGDADNDEDMFEEL